MVDKEQVNLINARLATQLNLGTFLKDLVLVKKDTTMFLILQIIQYVNHATIAVLIVHNQELSNALLAIRPSKIIEL